MRLVSLLFAVSLSLLVSISAPMSSFAQAGQEHALNILLLLDESYFVEEGDVCRVDLPDQERVLLKVENTRGARQGRRWFANGEVVSGSIGDGDASSETHCAFARTVRVSTKGEVNLFLHGTHLLRVNLSGIDNDEFLGLIVGSQGLVDSFVMPREDAVALGIDLPAPVASNQGSGQSTRSNTSSQSTNQDDGGRRSRPNTAGTTSSSSSSQSSSSSSSRSQSSRSNTSGNTSETNRSSSGSRNSSSSSRQQSAIITGEWELEGESVWDVLFVSIEHNYGGYGYAVLDELDPTELAVEVGFPLIGEGRAPDNCRIFAFSGPLGVAMYVSYCVTDEHVFYAGGTDKDVLDAAIDDFVNGRPFQIPRGYFPSY